MFLGAGQHPAWFLCSGTCRRARGCLKVVAYKMSVNKLQDVPVLWWCFLMEQTCVMQVNSSLSLLEQPSGPCLAPGVLGVKVWRAAGSSAAGGR